MIAVILLIATLSGCLATGMVGEFAQGEEPKMTESIVLTANTSAYEITRWRNSVHETLTIPRSELPTGCVTAHFFLNGSAHKLKIAEPTDVAWMTGQHPPYPDDSYPSCTFLVSYGAFSGPPELEGLFVTSSARLVATGKLHRPQPAAWVLMPVALVADIYIFIGALVTLPVWAPIGILWEKRAENREMETKESEKRVLPPQVAACWTAIDEEMINNRSSNPDSMPTGFEWDPGTENAYNFWAAKESFSENKPVTIDTRTKLSQGCVAFRSLWTSADIECGLQAGEVVATSVKFLE